MHVVVNVTISLNHICKVAVVNETNLQGWEVPDAFVTAMQVDVHTLKEQTQHDKINNIKSFEPEKNRGEDEQTINNHTSNIDNYYSTKEIITVASAQKQENNSHTGQRER